tara:strand:+ start:757 stop:1035 length:279 start_codon:yes stop_codon:yes gene_type:complete
MGHIERMEMEEETSKKRKRTSRFAKSMGPPKAEVQVGEDMFAVWPESEGVIVIKRDYEGAYDPDRKRLMTPKDIEESLNMAQTLDKAFKGDL